MGSHSNLQRNRPSMTRAVGWKFHVRCEGIDDLEGVTDDFLEKEIVRKGTAVTQYGTDGLILWINGAPGADMRKVIKKLKSLRWIPDRK